MDIDIVKTIKGKSDSVPVSTLLEALMLCVLDDLPTEPGTEELGKMIAESLSLKKGDRLLASDNIGEGLFVISALSGYYPELIDGSSLAEILMTLTSAESEEGGPYYYRVGEKTDIDLGVNACIAYFLSLQDVSLPSLDNLAEDAIDRNDFESDLFDSPYPVIYLISKYYKGERKEKLREIISSIEGDGDFSDLLLKLALKNVSEDEADLREDEMEEDELLMMAMILEKAENRFLGLSGDMRDLAVKAINKTLSGNKDRQMSLMPFYFKKALGERGNDIPDSLIADMGLANIFFWTAFIIYDDFWDEDESADPRMLPIANLFARHYVDFFSSLFPPERDFRSFFSELMDKLDEANNWETIHCRTRIDGSVLFIPPNLPEYRDYEFKYRPASGHILGCVAILRLLGFEEDSPETENLISYFRNYLIAMQINDDAHDWEEDMRRGHLSAVVTMLLREYISRYPEKKEVDMDKDIKSLQEAFWFGTIVSASETAIRHTDLSEVSLEAITVIEDLAPLRRFISISRNIAKKAIKEQADSVRFLERFEGV